MTKVSARFGGASIYKISTRPDRSKMNGDDVGRCFPRYRGFKFACTGVEIPALQRQVDAYWTQAYLAAQDRAGREAVLMAERLQRNAPKRWPL